MPTWTDAQLTRWMKDAEEDIVSQVYMRFESFSLAITEGLGTYSFDTRIYKTLSVLWKGKPLSPYIGREIHAISPKFRELSGEPTAYMMNNDGISTIRLIPVPNESIALYESGLYSTNIKNAFIIRAFVFPDRTLDHFQIPDYLHRNLVKCYVLARAFHAEGVGQNLKVAEYWQSRYMFLVDLLRSTRANYFQAKETLDVYETLDCQKKRLPRLPFGFVIREHILPLHGETLRDSLNQWFDNLIINLAVADDGGNLHRTFSDTLDHWNDELCIGHGHIHGDNLADWNEELTIVNNYLLPPFSDDLNNWSDSQSIGYGNIYNDDLNIWNDNIQLRLDYLRNFSDNLDNWNDAKTLILGYLRSFSDNLANWNDALTTNVVPVSDSDIPTDGLLVDLRITEGSGQTLNDSSGNGNHGQLGTTSGAEASDPTWTTSGGETVLDFDGVDDRFSIINDISAAFGGEGTMIVVVKLDAPHDTTDEGCWDTGTDTLVNRYLDNIGSLDADIKDGTLSTARKTSGLIYDAAVLVGPVATDTWHVVTVTSAAGDWDLYQNMTSVISTGTNTFGCPATLRFGISRGTTLFMSGQIARVIFYNKVLDGTERQQAYDAIKAEKPGLSIA